MRKMIDFWKRDIVNKLIVFIFFLLMLGVIGLAGLILSLPSGKSISGAIGAYFPTQTLEPRVKLTQAMAIVQTRSADETASVPPTPTTMTFKFPESSPTPSPTSIGQVKPSPTATLVEPTAPLPTATPTLTPAPTATQPRPTSIPRPTSGTAQPTSGSPLKLACIPNNPAQTGKVLSVIDGNTVKVLINGFAYNVRFIGVQLSTNKYFATLAAVTNNGMSFAKQVTLIPDGVDKDSHGYLLRYVLVGDKMPALELLKQGIVSTVDIPPDFACAQTFKDAQQAAQDQHLGIWVSTQTAP